MKLTYNKLQKIFKNKGYIWFTNINDLNIFGIRNNTNNDQIKDSFNDWIGVAWIDKNGEKNIKVFKATTDPGLKELQDPSFSAAQKDGTAILAEGQYRSAYKLGYHGRGNWQHPALVQVGKVYLYRDNNKDSKLDYINKQEALYTGINIHASSLWKETQFIGRYSAGCQVFANGNEYYEFIRIVQLQPASGLGDIYTYTLINLSDL